MYKAENIITKETVAAKVTSKLRCDEIGYSYTDQWGSFKAQKKLHFKAVFHAVH